jgi:S1-C subfamily serine protease
MICTGYCLDLFEKQTHFLRVPKKFLSFVVLALLAPLQPDAGAVEPERSVIQIVTYSQQPDWGYPWRFNPVQRSGGSGFVIKGGRIMSNAHVVSWARQIIVRRYQDPRQYVARVEFVGHDCDLAVLKVDDERFFEDLPTLEFGELPEVRSTVVTYGYPAGGEEISYTRGVVSRIQLQRYVHIGNRQLLGIQTDAAINPGNSGGPVIQDDKVVGVAFQGIPGLENAGFFIPPPIIDHFLKDIEDGTYDGFPMAGVSLVELQNSAQRSYLKLPENNRGARIDSIRDIESTMAVLNPDDVLLEVDGYPVASDGTVLYEGNRVEAALIFQLTQAGGSVPLKIWRDAQEKEVSLLMQIYEADKAMGSQYGNPPRYFVFGGMVFTPLSYDHLRSFGRDSVDSASADLRYELFYRLREEPDKVREEPIMLAAVLPDESNADMMVRGRVMVDTINGVRIENLESVIQALEGNTDQFDVIKFMPNQILESLEHEKLADANQRILQVYGISQDRRL